MLNSSNASWENLEIEPSQRTMARIRRIEMKDPEPDPELKAPEEPVILHVLDLIGCCDGRVVSQTSIELNGENCAECHWRAFIERQRPVLDIFLRGDADFSLSCKGDDLVITKTHEGWGMSSNIVMMQMFPFEEARRAILPLLENRAAFPLGMHCKHQPKNRDRRLE